jgi:hypothetical protein
MDSAERSCLRIPVRVVRPAATEEALRLSSLVDTRRAHSSGIERIPLIAAGASPDVFLAGRPAAARASDARRGWIVALLFFEFAIQNTRPGSDIHEVGVPLREQSNAQSSLCNRNGVYLRSPQNPRLGGSLWLPKCFRFRSPKSLNQLLIPSKPRVALLAAGRVG